MMVESFGLIGSVVREMWEVDALCPERLIITEVHRSKNLIYV